MPCIPRQAPNKVIPDGFGLIYNLESTLRTREMESGDIKVGTYL